MCIRDRYQRRVRGGSTNEMDSSPTLGYHAIRGLAAPLRMMFFYSGQNFTNVAYGADMKETWFGEDKPVKLESNACINLPYIQDGDKLITQSNTCLLYLGKKLGIDSEASFFDNHMVLDQTMDLRNDLMRVVYPFGTIKTKEEFPEGAKAHLAGSATTNFTKLEGFCQGPYMCGDAVQSGDFHVFEMLDQHAQIAASVGIADFLEQFPKLQALHAAFKADEKLAKYFAADCYQEYAHNNGLLTHFTGQGDDFVYGPTIKEEVKF
eukprot:TRINITY_DN9549_c0_g1_i1.p1 TRINITY_DN9549_c0_g1~~TRINITY_DN9549_c0_g1_i1.p1  ORF type:complete len:264 (+),score=83.04 TRINITY_DN9549_c0_g1_i1:93-884(+)